MSSRDEKRNLRIGVDEIRRQDSTVNARSSAFFMRRTSSRGLVSFNDDSRPSPTAVTNEPVVFDKFIHKELLVDRVRAVEYAMNHRRQESCSRGGWNLFFL